MSYTCCENRELLVAENGVMICGVEVGWFSPTRLFELSTAEKRRARTKHRAEWGVSDAIEK